MMNDLVRCLGPEEWRAIPSLPAYSVSSHGRIKRTAPVRYPDKRGDHPSRASFIKSRALPRGHLQVTLSIGGTLYHRLVHRLVAEAFLPPPAAGQDCVLHSDDDPSHNWPGNLRWGTKTDNAQDRIDRDRSAKGERVSSAKLTESDVRAIRARAVAGEPQSAIADAFGVVQTNVSMIVSRRTWRHVA